MNFVAGQLGRRGHRVLGAVHPLDAPGLVCGEQAQQMKVQERVEVLAAEGVQASSVVLRDVFVAEKLAHGLAPFFYCLTAKTVSTTAAAAQAADVRAQAPQRHTYQEVLEAAKARQLTLTEKDMENFYGRWPSKEIKSKRLLLAFVQELSESGLKASELINLPNLTNWSKDLGFQHSYLSDKLSNFEQGRITDPDAWNWHYATLWQFGLIWGLDEWN
jgi:hypothetical protein